MRRSLQCVMGLTLLSSAITFGQEAEHSGCALAAIANGQTVTVRGKIATAAHDMLLVVPNCEQSVVLVYAGDSETNVPVERLQRDQNLERFKKYAEATYKGSGKRICRQCAAYQVEASLTGQLDVIAVPEGTQRDQHGLLRDRSGKIVGTAGFGHPMPLYKYRLVIESVSDVVARKHPKPKASSRASESVVYERSTLLFYPNALGPGYVGSVAFRRPFDNSVPQNSIQLYYPPTALSLGYPLTSALNQSRTM